MPLKHLPIFAPRLPRSRVRGGRAAPFGAVGDSADFRAQTGLILLDRILSVTELRPVRKEGAVTDKTLVDRAACPLRATNHEVER